MGDLLESLDSVEDASVPNPAETPEAPPEAVVEAPEAEAPAPVAVVVPEPAPVATPPVVPLSAHIEERRKFQARIAELEGHTRLSTEDAALLKSLRDQKTSAETPKIPDFETDPKGHLDAKLKLATQQFQSLEEQTKALQSAQADGALMQQAASTEAAFRTEHPDYYDALNHVRSVRTAQLQLVAPQATAEQIQDVIRQEEVAALRDVSKRGLNPAAFAFDYAKTLGYKSPAAPVANGAAAAPVAAKPAAPVDRTAVRTLGSGGEAPAGDEDEDAMPEFKQALRERFRRS
jgi:hypothetical protein